MNLISKLPNLGLTIFSEMTQLANDVGAINLSQGFPDFEADPELFALVAEYMHQGCNQYAPMPGVPLLRERIADKVQGLYRASYDPASEITVTSGATEALFAAITSVVGPGDKVIVFEPAFDSYVPVIELCGGIPVYIQLKFPDYSVDWNEVRDAISEKTKLVILNFPHNPTGAVLKDEDITNLIDIVGDTNVVVISDEVYEHIVYDGHPHQSLAAYPELAGRSFVISSFGKTYHVTGWKIGYCLARGSLSKELQKIHQYLTFASNTPVQHALADFMLKKDVYLQLPAFYQLKRDLFQSLLQESRFKPLPCHGTYFQMVDYSSITRESDLEFARRLAVDHGVAAIPPSVFYHQKNDYNVLRFCFAKKDETLKEAAKRLCAV
ncbi:MAG: methionine aminotransferase [Desulfobacteraceae bacterium]|jgi:methionine aminotransferase|nr:methionine aminotransferase [Desulfobacteraceae bacterium]